LLRLAAAFLLISAGVRRQTLLEVGFSEIISQINREQAVSNFSLRADGGPTTGLIASTRLANEVGYSYLLERVAQRKTMLKINIQIDL